MAFSFASTLGWIELVPALIPIIKEAIIAVEGPGGGPDKFAAVVETVRLALMAILPGDATAETVEEILTFVKPLINLYVALFNKQGTMPTPPVVVVPPSVPGVPGETKEQLIIRISKIKERIAKLQAKPSRTSDEETQLANKLVTLASAEEILAKL